MKLKLGAGLFWTDETYDEYAQLVEDCEALGYETLWVTNEKFFHDMYVMGTVAAERTTRPKIGTFIADPYSMHPALTAMAIGTLDEVSRGRAVLGIGAGGTGFPPMGIQRVKPAVAIREAILLIRRLLAGETVDFQGEVIRFHNGRLNFKTRADIPIVVASRGDLVLQVGGEVADGVMIATYAEPVGIRHALSMIEKGAAKAGRSLSDLTIISRVDACISKDRREAIEAVKPMVGVFLWTSYPDRAFVKRVGLEVPDELERIIAKRDYNLLKENVHLIPDSFVDKFCWAGTAEEVAQKVARVAEMGITDITFLPHRTESGGLHETLREFAQTVKPMVEEMLARSK
ncbi:MAG: LLM class flavin-dependent oxidoreductase [Chloroflexota bacterium]|nr:MAG: hypothetical protein DIU68_02500 [Chloroflexota bacterium]